MPAQCLLPGPLLSHFKYHKWEKYSLQALSQLKQCYQTCDLGARLGYFWLLHRDQQSLAATLLLLGYFLLPRHEMSLNLASLWKIVNFLSIQGDFEPFQRQWADLSSIDKIKTSYGAIVGDYPQLPELDNLSFFHPIGWFWVNLPHKSAQNETVGRILPWWKIGLLVGYLPRPRIKFAAIWDSKFLATLSSNSLFDLNSWAMLFSQLVKSEPQGNQISVEQLNFVLIFSYFCLALRRQNSIFKSIVLTCTADMYLFI